MHAVAKVGMAGGCCRGAARGGEGGSDLRRGGGA